MAPIFTNSLREITGITTPCRVYPEVPLRLTDNSPCETYACNSIPRYTRQLTEEKYDCGERQNSLANAHVMKGERSISADERFVYAQPSR